MEKPLPVGFELHINIVSAGGPRKLFFSGPSTGIRVYNFENKELYGSKIHVRGACEDPCKRRKGMESLA